MLTCQAMRGESWAWWSGAKAVTCNPDSVAVDQGDNPQWLYAVVFTGNELWGPDADLTVQVSIEAFEPYLESA